MTGEHRRGGAFLLWHLCAAVPGRYASKVKTLVTYRSKYGSTRQYAQWIADELGADIMPVEDVDPSRLALYDTVIVGGYVRMGTIIGSEFIVRQWDALRKKDVMLFSVAGAPAHVPDRIHWFERSLPQHIHEQVTHFALRGRSRDLDLRDRLLIAFPKTLLRISAYFKPSDAKKKAIAGFSPFDAVLRETTAPIIAHVRSLA